MPTTIRVARPHAVPPVLNGRYGDDRGVAVSVHNYTHPDVAADWSADEHVLRDAINVLRDRYEPSMERAIIAHTAEICRRYRVGARPEDDMREPLEAALDLLLARAGVVTFDCDTCERAVFARDFTGVCTRCGQ